MSYNSHLTAQDWLRGWKEWARTRKRGKMAQFIVDKLEENKQARWLDVSLGKFELTEWHAIAEQWFKEKPRNSDQVDAPCMLRKGLPRAFPGLEEVKTESIKEGTQYKSRVFQAPHHLVQEVSLHVNNKAGLYPDLSTGSLQSSMGYVPNVFGYPATSVSTSQPGMMNGDNYSDGVSYPVPAMTSHPVSNHSQFSHVKLEAADAYSMGSPASDSSSPFSNYQGYSVPQPTIQESPGVDPLDMIASDIAAGSNQHSPYSTLERSPYSAHGDSPHYANSSSMLQLPPDSQEVWSNGGSPVPDPRYSPEPGSEQQLFQQQPVDMTQTHSASPVPQTVQVQQEFLPMKTFPNRSPVEGGGQLCLLFYADLPPGNKWVSFVSQQMAEFTTTVEAYQFNNCSLVTTIPKHAVPETVVLQIICKNQVLAQTEFTFFASATYQSEMLFQYLSQNLPSYFQQADLQQGGGGMGPDGGGGVAGGGYPAYLGGVPSSTYGLLLGACRLGLEPLVYATLRLPVMSKLTPDQLQRGQELAKEYHHGNLASVLGRMVRQAPAGLRSRGVGEEVEGECYVLLEELDKGGKTPEEGAAKVLGQLVKAAQQAKEAKEKLEKLEASPESEEPEQQVPGTPELKSEATPTATPTKESGRAPRRSNSGRLHRQERSVREDGDEDTSIPALPRVEGERPSRTSLTELEDDVPPLVSKDKFSANFRSNSRKTLLSAYSDADSAVSMSFDREELESEVQRRGSSSICSSGLFSLNLSDQGAVNIKIDPEAGYTFANSLQYECAYLVTEDYPPNEDKTIFKAGDRILAVGDTPTREMGPDDLAELLQSTAPKGTTVKILPRLERSPPPSLTSASLSSLDGDKKLLHRHSDQQLDSITMKVSNLLSMKASGSKRSVTLACMPADGYGFKMIGGNSVGLFVSEVRPGRKEVQAGDQILQINGRGTRAMTHYQATQLLRSQREKVTLTVMENSARFATIRDQFEFDSFYLRSQIHHSSHDHKDMRLHPGALLRVVNTIMYGDNYWLAWSVDEESGMDLELRRIPTPSRAKQQYGKDAYEQLQHSSLTQSRDQQMWEAVATA